MDTVALRLSAIARRIVASSQSSISSGICESTSHGNAPTVFTIASADADSSGFSGADQRAARSLAPSGRLPSRISMAVLTIRVNRGPKQSIAYFASTIRSRSAASIASADAGLSCTIPSADNGNEVSPQNNDARIRI